MKTPDAARLSAQNWPGDVIGSHAGALIPDDLCSHKLPIKPKTRGDLKLPCRRVCAEVKPKR